MSQVTVLQAQSRAALGKASTRRMRRLEDKVPAIIYGGKAAPQPISLAHNKLMHALEDNSLYSSVFAVEVDGHTEQVVLKALHRHPCKRQVLHLDLQRVEDDTTIIKLVPLRIVNADKAKGVKMGGKLVKSAVKVEVKCHAAKLPKEIELDISSLGIGQTLHLSDLSLPEGVKLTVDVKDKSRNLPVVAIQAGRKSAAESA